MDASTLQILIALGSALLGFAFSYALERIKRRREPNRQISWDAATEQGIIETHPDLREKIDVTYNGLKVDGLTAVTCRLTNTGNRVVKNQEVRFTFPAGVKLLDASLDPVPQREIGVTRITAKEAPMEAIYRIDHLEKGQDVIVKLLATGKEASDWKLFPFNQDGDVDFQQRDNIRRREEKEHVVPFLTILTVMIIFEAIAAPLASKTPFAYIPPIVELALAALLSSHVLPMARWIRDTFSSYDNSHSLVNTVRGGEYFVLAHTITGGVLFGTREKGDSDESDGDTK